MQGPIKSGTISSASGPHDNTIRTAIDEDSFLEWTGLRSQMKRWREARKAEIPLIKFCNLPVLLRGPPKRPHPPRKVVRTETPGEPCGVYCVEGATSVKDPVLLMLIGFPVHMNVILSYESIDVTVSSGIKID